MTEGSFHGSGILRGVRYTQHVSSVVVAFVVSMLVCVWPSICDCLFITPGIHYHEILVYMLVADAVVFVQWHDGAISLHVVIDHGGCS